jgi:glucose/arabinose dehydrogenase
MGRRAGARRHGSGGAVTALSVALALAVAMAACGEQTQQQRPTATPIPASTAAQSTARQGGSRAGVRFVKVVLRVPAANSGFGQPRAVTVPRGWTAEVWALVPAARLEMWTPEGDLLVSSPANGYIRELTPTSVRSQPPVQRTLVSGLSSPQGMAFAKLGGQEYLFVAESDEVDRYVWSDGTLRARTVIVHNLPDGGAHPLKNVVVAPDHTVYVDIGSDSNASPPGGTTPPRATVMAVDPNGAHLRVFATGVRNGDGLSFAPDGTLWTAVNERDDIGFPFHQPYAGKAAAYGMVIPSYVDNHPPDEVARLTAGRNLGWPYCNPDPDVDPGRAGTRMDYGSPRFDADVQTNAGRRALNCATLPSIQRGLPAHSAPLGFHFLNGSGLPRAWSDGAVVAVHGSWDREPPRAPAVLWMPWDARSRTLGAAVTLIGGFQEPNGSRWGRTVDAVPGPDGALYVSDDQAGAIYRLVPSRG